MILYDLQDDLLANSWLDVSLFEIIDHSWTFRGWQTILRAFTARILLLWEVKSKGRNYGHDYCKNPVDFHVVMPLLSSALLGKSNWLYHFRRRELHIKIKMLGFPMTFLKPVSLCFYISCCREFVELGESTRWVRSSPGTRWPPPVLNSHGHLHDDVVRPGLGSNLVMFFYFLHLSREWVRQIQTYT